MKTLVHILILGAAAVPGTAAYAAMLGLGLHRHAPPWVVSLSATLLVFGPPLTAAALAIRNRVGLFGLLLGTWSVAVLAALPVYFPGERRQAVVTGFSLINAGDGWESIARSIAARLPDEPQLAKPEVPEAMPLVEPALASPIALAQNQIALPFEGAGRRLSVPVTFLHGGKELEREMMLDTGATYTTLPLELLEALGAAPTDDSPVIVLHTANGEREAKVVLLETVWLGDLKIEGVAVATCEACSSTETAGLLGLNVTGNYNMMIDADRREVVFTSRTESNRRLDVGPFADVTASLSRYPGGRMEVDVKLENRASRDISSGVAEIRCDSSTWAVQLAPTEAGSATSVRRRLPEHTPCDRYQVSLDTARW